MNFIELNEHGLMAVDNQDFERAVNLYRHALMSLNKERYETPKPVGSRPCSYRVLSIPLELDDDTPFTEPTASQDGQFVLYDTSYLIEYRDVWYAYPFAVTTLLYNIAMALHVDALETPNATKLNQAKEIYTKALDFFLSTGRSILDDTRKGELRGFFFAMYNNYGHCCSLLSDMDGVKQAQENLATLLSDPFSSAELGPIDEAFFRASLVIGVLKESVSCIAPGA